MKPIALGYAVMWGWSAPSLAALLYAGLAAAIGVTMIRDALSTPGDVWKALR